LSQLTVASCSFTSDIQCVRLDDALLKCVVTEVVSFSIVALKTQTFHKVE